MNTAVSQRHDAILQLLAERSPRRVNDIAAELGVSIVTARRDVDTLANEGRLRRTHGSVAALQPEAAALGERATVGLIVPDAEYYYGAVLQGARAAGLEAGVRIVLGVSAYDASMERRLADRLLDSGVDGLLIAPTPDFGTGAIDPEQQEWLASLDVPVVLIERPVEPGGAAARLDRVESAHAAGTAAAVRHLVELGHRKVALVVIAGPNTGQIRAGYRAAIAATGIESAGEVDEGQPGSDDAAERIVGLLRDEATALIVHNDQLAMRLTTWLGDAGIEAPRDVSIVCYDDVIAPFVEPALTAVAPQKRQVGDTAVRLVAKRIRQRREAGGAAAREAEYRSLVPLLHVRASTGAPQVAVGSLVD